MYYEINIARDGKHLFATAPRSLSGNTAKAEALFDELCARFLDCEVSLTRYEETGHLLAVKSPSK